MSTSGSSPASALGANRVPHPESLLLVDDDEVFRERLARSFRTRGYEVRTAGTVQEAKANANEDSPELAVVDLRMPGGSGLDAVSELKAVDPATRVMVLTGYGSIATAVDAIKRGAENYLSKPADADQIIAAFARAAEDKSNGDAEGAGAQRAPQPRIDTPTLARVEWEHIQRVLSDCDNNISEAARRLGIHRRSLQRKLQKYAPR